MLAMAVSSCAPHEPPILKLAASEVLSCRASGGYESRTPFGQPFCQQRFADGGKSCSTKSDCTGRCLSDDDRLLSASVGTPSKGHCEAERQSFGCFVVIDEEKIARPYTCYE